VDAPLLVLAHSMSLLRTANRPGEVAMVNAPDVSGPDRGRLYPNIWQARHDAHP
jgi:hypothetical protein